MTAETQTPQEEVRSLMLQAFDPTCDDEAREQIQQRLYEIESAEGLANLPRVKREKWCACPTSENQESYYQAPDGRHGWFHDPLLGGCGAVTQTG